MFHRIGGVFDMLKRTFDIVASLLGLVILTPAFVVISIIIRLQSRGPVMYKAVRVGKGGRVFHMFKFRTMIHHADRHGPLVTAGDDWRVTPVGRLLRKAKLDELPTLWNVLVGDMSFVGPRPENPKSAALYTKEQRRIWRVRPGITSLATVKYRHEEAMLAGASDLDAKYYEIMQDKLRLELEYLDRQSVLKDFGVLARTMVAILCAKVSNA